MNADIERDDTYVGQLYQVFKSCDIDGTGLLGEDELFSLCTRLQLDDNQTNYIITNLIGDDLIAKINFDDFKEIFVSLLTQSQSNTEEQYSRIDSNEAKNISYNNNSNQLNSNLFENMNTEQYLRSIWERLGVGVNGYLNTEELYRVCEHIGMIGINSEVIDQLFGKLDTDQDGKVSFDEFLEGLFQHDSATTCDNSDNAVNNVNLIQLQTPDAPYNPCASDREDTSEANDNDLNESLNQLMSEENNTLYTNMCTSYLNTLDPDTSG